MKEYNRREFLGSAVGLALAGCRKYGELEKRVVKSSGFVTVDGIKLGYVIEGTGIPCVVPHDVSIMTRALSKELRKHFKFIFLDSRNEVPSDKSVEIDKITMDTYVDDIEKVRRTLGFDRIAVLGHSIYGLLALEYARKYPEHVTHVIMNGTPPIWPSNLTEYMEEIANKYWESDASDERRMIFKQNWGKLPEDTFGTLSPSEARVLQYITNGPKYWYDPTYDCSWLLEGTYWNVELGDHFFNVIMAEYDIAEGDEIATPVFLSLGRHDYVVPYTLWDDYKDKLPNLSYNLFKKSGHYPMLEEQALFDKKLIGWIKGQ